MIAEAHVGDSMAVISFANSKGGAGKTTAALLLGMALAHQGQVIAILDADPQAWMTTRFEVSSPVDCLSLVSGVTAANLPEHLRRLHGCADHVIIDLSGASDVLVALAAGLSDLVLVPVQGCALDGRGAARVLELIQYVAGNTRTPINHSVVLTRVSSMVTTRAVRSVKALLASRGVPLLEAPIVERSAYRDMFDYGGSLYGLEAGRVSNLAKALGNMHSFAQAVLALLAGDARPASSGPFSRTCYRTPVLAASIEGAPPSIRAKTYTPYAMGPVPVRGGL